MSRKRFFHPWRRVRMVSSGRVVHHIVPRRLAPVVRGNWPPKDGECVRSRPMAVAEATEVATRECPACGGGMEATYTLCPECRSHLEDRVMTAPVPIEAIRAAAVAAAAKAAASPPPYVPPPSRAPRLDRPERPERPERPAQPVPAFMPADPAGRLEPRSRWQHAAIAAGLIIVVGVLAAGVWSFMTPHSDSGDDDVTSPSSSGGSRKVQASPSNVTGPAESAAAPAVAPATRPAAMSGAAGQVRRVPATAPVARTSTHAANP